MAQKLHQKPLEVQFGHLWRWLRQPRQADRALIARAGVDLHHALEEREVSREPSSSPTRPLSSAATFGGLAGSPGRRKVVALDSGVILKIERKLPERTSNRGCQGDQESWFESTRELETKGPHGPKCPTVENSDCTAPATVTTLTTPASGGVSCVTPASSSASGSVRRPRSFRNPRSA